MRQFVVGLLVLAFAWWGCSRWGSAPANAGGDVTKGSGAPAPTGSLDQVLGRGAANTPPTPAPAPTSPPPAAVAPSTGALDARPVPVEVAPADLEELMLRVAGGDAASRSLAWQLLATKGLGDQRKRVVDGLLGATDDFATMFAALGSDNACLHSPEGRTACGKVLTAALLLPDGESLAATSNLLGLCVRGRIERGDTEVRAFVDKAYAQHLLRVDRWLCDPANVARARSYTIERGDSLASIATKFRAQGAVVESGTLALLNRIHNPNAIAAQQKIKVPIDPIVAVLEKRSFALGLYVGDNLLRLYWVGHGENDKTPVTEFTVTEKQPRPEWTAPNGERYPYGHPKNILGEYFIKFRHERYTGFGAHGTPMPETIGTMSSAGCIRMLAPDIEELFRILPRGARVQVRCTESIR